MAQSFLPMLLLGPTLLLAQAGSGEEGAADADPRGPTALRRPPPTSIACDPQIATSTSATL
jgi:hypothetical protein